MPNLEALARRYLPRRVHGVAFRLYAAVLTPWMRRREFGTAHECPLCGSQLREFKTFRKRRGEKCPVCGSMKRHRLIWLFLTQRTDLCDGTARNLLHIAPEPPMTLALRKIPGLSYLSADLDSPFAEMRMDITQIERADGSFDAIYCSHVLEHVPDDRRAMRELLRVLRPAGWAILQVPITKAHTEEDLSIDDPKERQRRYGHPGHVRGYGPDYADRLREAGFEVDVVPFAAELGAEARVRFGLPAEEDVYFCRKRA